jgi:hypothetical protein
LLVALNPLAHALWGGVASWCGFAVVLGLLVDVDDAFACLDGFRGVYLLIGKFHRGRAFCCARCGAVLRAVRLLFSSVGSGWATGAGVNEVLAHLPHAVAQRRAVCFVRNARSVSIAL